MLLRGRVAVQSAVRCCLYVRRVLLPSPAAQQPTETPSPPLRGLPLLSVATSAELAALWMTQQQHAATTHRDAPSCARVAAAQALDTWNWRLLDPAGAFEVGNLTLLSRMTPVLAEVNFHLLPCAMHAAAAPLILRAFRGPELIHAADDVALVALLEELRRLFERFKEMFSEVGPCVGARDLTLT